MKCFVIKDRVIFIDKLTYLSAVNDLTGSKIVFHFVDGTTFPIFFENQESLMTWIKNPTIKTL